MLSTHPRCCRNCRLYVEQPDALHPRELLASYRYCVDAVPVNVDQRVFLEPLYSSHRDAVLALNARLNTLPHKESSEVSSEKDSKTLEHVQGV